MKEINYVVNGAGAQRTIAARSDRAKKRTPEPRKFNDNASALEFVKAADMEAAPWRKEERR